MISFGEGVAVEGEHCQVAGIGEGEPAFVEEAARCRLQRQAQFQGWVDRFDFEYVKPTGVLKIVGTAPSFYVKQLAQIVLKNINGVRRIDNRLQVVSPLTANNARVGTDDTRPTVVGRGGQHDDCE